ncbi:hypothetical protein KCP75_12090 [Salmonella enterica subsp. enterica]|nr:hypothetical protein KCP75_12090 [Salmonella enterica subsp. enterica]
MTRPIIKRRIFLAYPVLDTCSWSCCYTWRRNKFSTLFRDAVMVIDIAAAAAVQTGNGRRSVTGDEFHHWRSHWLTCHVASPLPCTNAQRATH